MMQYHEIVREKLNTRSIDLGFGPEGKRLNEGAVAEPIKIPRTSSMPSFYY